MPNRNSSDAGRSVRVVAYYRMSTSKQDKSIPEQRAAVEDYAKRQGYEIDREYIDAGISGDKTEKRAEFQRMLADGVGGEFDLILCWDQDRFGRFDPIEGGFWIHPLRKQGVVLETVLQGRIDWNDFGGRLMWTVNQEAKHGYERTLSANVLRGMASAVAKGHWPGSKAPYGYRTTDAPGKPEGARDWPRVLVPDDPEKVEVVRWLFNTYADRDVSIRWLAQQLTERGVKTPDGKDHWRPVSIGELLRRRVYVGDLEWNRVARGGYHRWVDGKLVDVPVHERGKNHKMSPDNFTVVEGAHEPLIDRETWERVQVKLSENAKRTTPKPVGAKWVLSGLLTCGHCGGGMHGETNLNWKQTKRDNLTVWRRYRCTIGHQTGNAGCHCHHVMEPDMLRVIARKLRSELLNAERLAALRAEIRRQDEAERAESDPSEVNRLRGRVSELDRKIAKGEENLTLAEDADTLGSIAKTVRGWKQERDAARAELERLERGANAVGDLEAEVDAALEVIECIEGVFERGDPSEVGPVIREFVRNVELFWKCGDQTVKGPHRRCQFSHGTIHLKIPSTNLFGPVSRNCSP